MAAPTRRILLLAAAAVVLIAGTAALLWPSQLCPKCYGFSFGHTPDTRAGLKDPSGLDPCVRCDGRGSVSPLNAWFGPPANEKWP